MMTVKQGVKENVQHHSNNANILDVLNQFKFSLKLIFFWKKQYDSSLYLISVKGIVSVVSSDPPMPVLQRYPLKL